MNRRFNLIRRNLLGLLIAACVILGVQNYILTTQLRAVDANVAAMEETLSLMRKFRFEVDDLVRAPRNELTEIEHMKANVKAALSNLREEDAIADESRSIASRVSEVNEQIVSMNLMLKSLTTILGHSRQFLEAIPSITPATGWVSSNYGHRVSPFSREMVIHRGLDIGTEEGTPIVAAADGVVLYSGNSDSLGKLVILEHEFNIVTKYAHSSKLLVKKGEYVRRGDVIALVGTTGRSTGPHLHYEVWVNGKVANPADYLLDRTLNVEYMNMSNYSTYIGGDEVPEVKTVSANAASIEPGFEVGAEMKVPEMKRDQARSVFSWKQTLSAMVIFLCGIAFVLAIADHLKTNPTLSLRATK